MDALSTLGTKDSYLQKGLRKYGNFVGKYWLYWGIANFIIMLALVFGGWSTRKIMGGSKDVMNPATQVEQWSEKGGPLEKNLKYFYEQHGEKNDWMQKASVTMFTPKGYWDNENRDANLLTKDALIDMYNLQKKWTEQSVTVNGLTYTTWDLCARGILPDLPAGQPSIPDLPYGSPVMQCMVISPLHCFKDALNFTAPLYQMMDKTIEKTLPGFLSYDKRPSLWQVTDADIGRILSTPKMDARGNPVPGENSMTKGCYAWHGSAFFMAEMWAGKTKSYVNGTLDKVTAFRHVINMDAVERIKYRMSVMAGEAMYTKMGMKPFVTFGGVGATGAIMKNNTITPAHADTANIEAAQKELSAKWAKICEEFSKNEARVTTVDNSEDFAYYTGEQMEKEQANVDFGFFIGGGLIMVAFCCFTLISWNHPAASRAHVGLWGLVMILLAEQMAFGFMFICDFYLNPAIIIAMPLLAIGLGCDDMFVLIRYFSRMGHEFLVTRDESEILGELMATAGVGTTLSSCCNICAFGVGTFLKIPGMADFCRCAVMMAAFNYFVMSTIFLVLFVPEIKRLRAGGPDPHFVTMFWHMHIIKKDKALPTANQRMSILATSSDAFTKSTEKRLLAFVRDKYAPFMCKPVVAVTTSIVALTFFAVSFFLIINCPVGWQVADLFSDGPAKRGIELVFQEFSLFPASLVVHDVDVAERQDDIIDLYDKIANIPSGLATAYPTPNFLTMMQAIMYEVSAGAAVAMLKAQNITNRAPTFPETLAGGASQGLFFDMSSCSAAGCPKPDLAPLGKFPASLEFSITDGKPIGVPGFGSKSDPGSGIQVPYWDKVFNSFRNIPANPFDAWNPAKQGFMYADMAGVNKFAYHKQSGVCGSYDGVCAVKNDPMKQAMCKGGCSDSDGCHLLNTSTSPLVQACRVDKPKMVLLPFLGVKLDTEDKFITQMQDTDAVLASSNLKDNAFIYGPIDIFWRVFVTLKADLTVLIIVDCAIIFVIALLFFSGDVVTAFITSLCCSMIVVEIYAVASTIMSFNIFTAALVLMSMGLAVEFVAHLAAAFSSGDGDISERLSYAMADTFPALMDGSCSTFFGILPLCLHPIAFIVKYIFGILTLIVGVGLLNGLVFMPAILVVLSPILPYVKCRKGDGGQVVEIGVKAGQIGKDSGKLRDGAGTSDAPSQP